MEIKRLKEILDELIPELLSHQTSLVIPNKDTYVVGRTFGQFQENESAIQRYVRPYVDNHILVVHDKDMVAYCSLPEVNVTFKLENGAFQLTYFSLCTELIQVERIHTLSGKTLEEEVLDHFKKERQKRSS